MYVGKQLVLRTASRRVVPGTIWRELHAYYRLAEMLDAPSPVSDNLLPNGGISCYATYSRAAAGARGSVCDVGAADRGSPIAGSLVGAQGLSPTCSSGNQRPVITIDLDGGAGATLAGADPDPACALSPASDQRPALNACKWRQSGGIAARARCSINNALRSGALDSLVPALPAPVGPAERRSTFIRRPSGCFRIAAGSRADPRAGSRLPETRNYAGCGPDPSRPRGAEAEWAWEQWEGPARRHEASLVRFRPALPLGAGPARDSADRRRAAHRVRYPRRPRCGRTTGCGRTARLDVADVVR